MQTSRVHPDLLNFLDAIDARRNSVRYTPLAVPLTSVLRNDKSASKALSWGQRTGRIRLEADADGRLLVQCMRYLKEFDSQRSLILQYSVCAPTGSPTRRSNTKSCKFHIPANELLLHANTYFHGISLTSCLYLFGSPISSSDASASLSPSSPASRPSLVPCEPSSPPCPQIACL